MYVYELWPVRAPCSDNSFCCPFGRTGSVSETKKCVTVIGLFFFNFFLLSSQVSLVSHSGTVCEENFNQSGFHVFGERTRW